MRRGPVFDLAHVLHADIPAFPGRTFRQYLTTNAHEVNRRGPTRRRGLGPNNVNWVVEQVTATQQMGTHLDALNHLQVGTGPTTGTGSPTSPRSTGPTSSAWTRCRRS